MDGIQGKTTKFVINFYHTTSRLLVNGSRVDLFINDIHELLHRELSNNGHDLTVLNHHINSTINNAVTPTSTNLDINMEQTKCSNEYTADL